jgi:hypothetical protein
MKKWNLVFDNVQWKDCVVNISLVNNNQQAVDFVIAISEQDGTVGIKNAIARFLVPSNSSVTVPNIPIEFDRKLFVHPSSVHTSCSVNGTASQAG